LLAQNDFFRSLLGYDGESRVITASNSGNSGSYNYGGDGLRVHQVSGSTVSNSIYSGSGVIGQYDNESGALQEYIYAGGQMLAAVGATSNSNRSFEQGLSGWTSTGSSVQVITNSANAHSGSNYVQISTSSTASVSPPTFSVQPGDQVDFGGWIYLQSGSAAAVDWVLNALDVNHNLVAAVVPVPWSVTTAGVWTYETGSYTVPSGVAYITFLGQVYEASGTTTARFDDGFIIVGTHYFQPDHLSTRLLTDSGGNVVGQQGHYPYGESWYAKNTTTNWQFTSYQRDNESGNDYALMRSYVNRLARFSSPDPAGLAAVDPSNPQSWNRYAYVTNDPAALTDPTGLCTGTPRKQIQGLCGAGFGGDGDCSLDGVSFPCDWANGLLNSPGGAVGVCQFNNCLPVSGSNGNLYQTTYTTEGWSYINPLNGDSFTDGSELGLPNLGDPLADDGSGNGSGGGQGSGNSGCIVPRVLAVIPQAQPTGAWQNQGGHQQSNFTFSGDLSTFAPIAPKAFSIFGVNNGYRFGGVFFSLHINSVSFNPIANETSFQGHEDVFNPATGLFGIVGHTVVDLGIGTLFFNHSSRLDRGC
jgi:RHS repeat-associated protein